MDSLIHLDIAGIRSAFEIADAGMRARVRERYGPFIADPGPAQLRVVVQAEPGARYIALRAGDWPMELQRRGERLTYRSYYDQGWVDFARGEAFLQIAPEAELENFVRVLYAHLAVRAGGLLLHAAGAVKDGRGFVFFGPSGSGKSTSARLSFGAGHTVLSDDLVIVRRAGAQFRVYGVPFRGSERFVPLTRMDAELSGLFALSKAGGHALERLPLPAAVARLLRVVPFVMTQPESSARVVALCTELAQSVFVGELHFRKDAEFWGVIDGRVAVLPDSA